MGLLDCTGDIVRRYLFQSAEEIFTFLAAMAFGDLTTEEGLQALNSFLADRSYIEGYAPSQADAATVAGIAGKAPGAAYPHALRWYNHIMSMDLGKNAAHSVPAATPAAAPAKAAAPADDDDEVDLFADSDEEDDEEAAKIKEARVAAYKEKKSQKAAVIAKSSIVLDVKPWDDETDMKETEAKVRTIVADGLVWGASKLVPVGYGIMKLQIGCVVEDLKVSVDWLSEEICNFEELVQSVDIAAFQKI